ncbi:OprD family porin [Sulfurimonas sediminis]|uniref:OprD family porin n=1 Tax=Sulfurimonas sediminis TaxID=2590020 RepID=A0A7M1B275_9BACT|nr:porin [Sulfurimonas sediminis]QOP43867.1 OprD family porin [Sulfurimonas sediminis]
MKKIALSMFVTALVTSVYADYDGVNIKLKHGITETPEVHVLSDDIKDMFLKGTTSGQIRMFYVDRQYQGGSGADTYRDATVLGGHLKYETATLNGIRLAAAFYTVQDLGVQQHTAQSPALLGTGYKSYSILGEGYLGYNFSEYGLKSDAKLGYQRYDSLMMGSDDARTLPNTFRAYKFVSKDVKNITVQIAHVDRIAYGTFANIYSAGGILAATSGYTSRGVNASTGVSTGEYLNLGLATTGKKTAGVTNIQLKYTAKNFHIDVSNDYAWNLYNTLYADAGVSWNCLLNSDVKPFVKVQMIKQNSVGKKYMQYSPLGGSGEVDSFYWAGKIGAKYEGFATYIAYSQASSNNAGDDAYKNAILTQFGGMPAYTQGMVTRHMFLAGTKATKVAAVYNFKQHGVNLSTAAYYCSFDTDANSGYGVARTATEAGFDIKYYPKAVEKLQLRFRGNFPRKFAETTPGSDTGWNEYRLIANYNF